VSAGVWTSPLLWTFGGVLVLLVTATMVTAILSRSRPAGALANVKLRIRSWWIIAIAFTIAIAGGRTTGLVFFAFVSYLALKEYLTVVPTRRSDRTLLLWTYIAIPVQYYWVATRWYGMFIIFIPVYMFLFLPIRLVLTGETKGFLRAAGTLHWGLMVTVFSLSHAAYLINLPGPGDPPGTGVGLVVFLAIVTQMGDVSQYLWGKWMGRRRVVAKVSPNKTWEGLIGGVATAVALAVLMGPALTPLGSGGSAVAGAIIGLSGFFGDVTLSAVKRDLGMKDSGSLIPGHGGVLDRVDSLTYTAPLFFHFVKYFYF
jgi:phosphatidate cytidylyltransferase